MRLRIPNRVTTWEETLRCTYFSISFGLFLSLELQRKLFCTSTAIMVNLNVELRINHKYCEITKISLHKHIMNFKRCVFARLKIFSLEREEFEDDERPGCDCKNWL